MGSHKNRYIKEMLKGKKKSLDTKKSHQKPFFKKKVTNDRG